MRKLKNYFFAILRNFIINKRNQRKLNFPAALVGRVTLKIEFYSIWFDNKEDKLVDQPEHFTLSLKNRCLLNKELLSLKFKFDPNSKERLIFREGG